MPDTIDAIERFRTAITPFLLSWQSIGIRAILDLSEGQVLSLVACLSPEPPSPLEDIEPVVRDVLFSKGALPISELNSFLDGWTQGLVSIGQRSFMTSSFSTREFSDIPKPGDDVTSAWPEMSNYRHFLIRSHGPTIHELTESRNLESVATALGFRSFPEMSRHRVQFEVGQSRVTRMEMFAPVLATIEVSPDGKEVRFEVSVHATMRPNEMHLSYRLQDNRGNRVIGGQLGLSEFSGTLSGGVNVLEYGLPLTDEAQSGEANLFHSKYHLGSEPLVTKFFVLPPAAGKTNPYWDLIMSLVSNTRAFMGKKADPEMVIREDWLGLGSKRVEEQAFSKGMSCLLFAAGFTKLSIGSEAEGVDEVIQTVEPERLAILFSYTTGPNVGEKARKLNVQVERLRKTLQDYDVRAAIVIPLDEGDLFVRDVEDCKVQNIKLVLRPRLVQMLQAVQGRDWAGARNYLIQQLTQEQSIF